MKAKKSGTLALIIVSIIALYVVGTTFLIIGLSTYNPYYVFVFLGAIFLLLGILFTCLTISDYNLMIKYKNKVSEALALIDIHLKMRFDLVPNLVNVVKGYAKHEQETFKSVIEVRNKFLKTKSEEKKIDCANKCLSGLKTIFSVVENYPELKASKVFKNLMDELSTIEDKLVAARRIYDGNVTTYNTYIQVFPKNILAGIFGFEPCKLFKIDTGENILPEVKL